MSISIFFINWKAIYIYITVVRSSHIYMYCALYRFFSKQLHSNKQVKNSVCML